MAFFRLHLAAMIAGHVYAQGQTGMGGQTTVYLPGLKVRSRSVTSTIANNWIAAPLQ